MDVTVLRLFAGTRTIRSEAPDFGIPSSALRRDDGRRKKDLRYLAEAEPDFGWLQLSLEQVPMKGLQK